MRLLILIFSLQLSALSIGFCAPAFSKSLAFQRQQPVGGGSGWGSPTNNTDGTVPLAWYVASDYVTNGGTSVSLPDRWTNAWHLTNLEAATKWPVYNATGINNQPTILFNGNDAAISYLWSLPYTSAYPHEVFCVVNVKKMIGFSRVFDSADASVYHRLYVDSSGNEVVHVPTTAVTAPSAILTNTWVIYDALFDSTAGLVVLRTNNVAKTTGTLATTKTMNGFTLNSKGNVSNSGTNEFAEIITYGGPLSSPVPGTNTTWRSNVWYYLKSKYAL